MIDRRSLITGLISLVAAPAIIRAGSLMPVKVMEPLPVIGQLDWLRVPGFCVDIITMNGELLYRADGIKPLTAGDLVADQIVPVTYDGVKWLALELDLGHRPRQEAPAFTVVSA